MKFKDYKNIQLSRLGMGNMRLPRVNNEPKGEIDYPAAKAMIDSAMANGINYYDTAYVYHEHTSEAFLGKALKDYPRDDSQIIVIDDDPRNLKAIRNLNEDIVLLKDTVFFNSCFNSLAFSIIPLCTNVIFPTLWG